MLCLVRSAIDSIKGWAGRRTIRPMDRLPESFQRVGSAALGVGINVLTIGLQFAGFTSRALAIVLYVIGTAFLVLWLILVSPMRRLRIFLIPKDWKGRNVQLTTVFGRTELFKSACSFLRSKSFGELIIYAPTGAWEVAEADPKWQWFRTIATCLVNAQPIPKNSLKPIDTDANAKSSLGSFRAVFGLPPHPTMRLAVEGEGASAIAVNPRLVRKEWNEFFSHLDKIQAALSAFNGIPTAHLRYLDADITKLPGMGCIVFDDQAVAMAVTIGGKYQVDYCYTVIDKEVGGKLKDWFHTWVFPIAEENVLQDIPRKKISLEDGFKGLRSKYKKLEAEQLARLGCT
jgi:hypothetical protein